MKVQVNNLIEGRVFKYENRLYRVTCGIGEDVFAEPIASFGNFNDGYDVWVWHKPDSTSATRFNPYTEVEIHF